MPRTDRPGTEEAAAAASAEKRDRVFLVVVDDSPERAVALKYACLRARKGGGRVALLRVIEPVGLVEWAGVGVMMQEERREEAEKLLSGLAAQVNEITGTLPDPDHPRGRAARRAAGAGGGGPAHLDPGAGDGAGRRRAGAADHRADRALRGEADGADDDRAGGAGRQGTGSGDVAGALTNSSPE